MAKSQKQQSFRWKENVEKMTISVYDRDGKLLATFDTTEVKDEVVRKREFLYGHKKLLQDRTSDEDSATKVPAMQEIHNLLVSGEFEKERVGGVPTMAAEVEVLMAIGKVSAAEARLTWKESTDDQKERFREKFAKKIEAIKEGRKTAETRTLDDFLK